MVNPSVDFETFLARQKGYRNIKKPVESRSVIHNAIKRHAGLSDFDDEDIAAEVSSIFRALQCNGFAIVRTKE